MRVLITGGAGFIGQHLAARLVDQGHQVVALDLLNSQVHPDPEAARRRFPGEVIQADVAEPESWEHLPTVDAMVHLAAETGTGQSMYEADRYRRTNLVGSELAAQFAAHHGLPVVFTSSRAVYGEGAPGVPTREDAPHLPTSVYGETKSLAEQAMRDTLTHGLTILRPQNVIGPGQSLHNPYTGVLAAFVAMAKELRPLTVYGDGLGTRDFVHVHDVVEVIEHFVEHPAPEAQVFNVGSGEAMTFVQVAQAVLAACPTPEVGWEHLPMHRSGDIEHACADLTALLASGAPAPRWSGAEAIAHFVTASWPEPGAPSRAWDLALSELAERGLIEEA